MKPGQSSQIKTNYKCELARNIEPLITEKQVRELGVGTVDPVRTTQSGLSYVPPPRGPRPQQPRSSKQVLEGGQGPFVEHCKSFEERFEVSDPIHYQATGAVKVLYSGAAI